VESEIIMGLFGDQDASEISDNPFYVAPDDYNCILSEAERIEKKDGSGEGIAFKWVVTDDDSDYEGSSISDWLNIHASDSNFDGNDTAAKIRQDNARLKKRLTEMGLTLQQQNDLLDDDNLVDLIGMTAVISVTESKNKNDPEITYTNVGKVTVE